MLSSIFSLDFINEGFWGAYVLWVLHHTKVTRTIIWAARFGNVVHNTPGYKFFHIKKSFTYGRTKKSEAFVMPIVAEQHCPEFVFRIDTIHVRQHNPFGFCLLGHGDVISTVWPTFCLLGSEVYKNREVMLGLVSMCNPMLYLQHAKDIKFLIKSRSLLIVSFFKLYYFLLPFIVNHFSN